MVIEIVIIIICVGVFLILATNFVGCVEEDMFAVFFAMIIQVIFVHFFRKMG